MEIDITKEKGRFSAFINEEENANIIFSGIFGIGKTYFIHKFFEDENQEGYIPIYITPVQYSVASNEDIFELIKFDILFQLMGKGIEFDNRNLSFLDSAQWLLHFNIDNFIIKLLQVTSKVKLGVDVLSPLLKLKKNVEDFRNQTNITSEQALVNTFLSQNKEKTGSIYEENIITHLISSCVLSLKEDGKKVVLVIDDLDRIDPEHIFRILNILSVHENFHGAVNENKFDFDRTILICDANNIKKIYHTKYGIDVDFNGYIDKFYSKRIYHFDNISQIINQISFLLGTIQSDQADLETPSTITYKACKVILSALVKSNKLNIRNLLKVECVILKNSRRIYLHGFSLNIASCPSLVIMDFLRDMFCTIADMENAITNLNENELIVEEPHDFLTAFLVFADFQNNRFDQGDYNAYGIEYGIPNITVPSIAYLGTKCYTDFKDKIKNISIKQVLFDAFTNYKNHFS